MCRYLRSSAVNRPVGLGDYTRAMMINHILTICAAALSLRREPRSPMRAGLSGPGRSPAESIRSGSLEVISTVSRWLSTMNAAAPANPSSTRSTTMTRRTPERGQRCRRPVRCVAQRSALRPPGWCAGVFRPWRSDAHGSDISPDDPRYGRPRRPRLFGPRRRRTGPVLSPDDPRYGRPAGPPAVIYADRSPGSQQRRLFGSRRQPHSRRRHRLSERRRVACVRPGAIGSAPACTGAAQPPAVGADGRPVELAALPPEEQPEVGPAQLRRTCAARKSRSRPRSRRAPSSSIPPNTYLYYVLGGGRAIRYGVRVGRDGFTWTGVQKITARPSGRIGIRRPR